jgi:colanic acid/amylovoran biosynthesis glycosyltransferase
MRIAYFTNQYPAVSHTFIRREIRALEAQGVTVVRYALQSSPQRSTDIEDAAEQEKTRYILAAGFGEFVRCCLTAFARPIVLTKTVRLLLQIGWHSDRGLLRHFAYLIEAVVLAQWCRRDAITHIHAHFGTNSATIVMLASLMSGIPYSFTAHGPDEYERPTLLALDVKLRRAAFAVCVSSYGRSQLMRWSEPDQWNKIALVRCGLDAAYFDENLARVPESGRLVCVARLEEQKAHLILIAAARRLHEAGVDFEIVLIGDGSMRSRIEEEIRDLGLQRQIRITGWLSGERVKSELAAARALILPSFAENLPVVIMEAMASGRPVISTHVAGIPELVIPQETGWLVPASDVGALAGAMQEVLAESAEKLTEMGLRGRARVVESHDVRKEAAMLKMLFESNRNLATFSNSYVSAGDRLRDDPAADAPDWGGLETRKSV